MQDDLNILRENLESSLEFDFVQVKFKNGYTSVYTKTFEVAGECDIAIIDSPSNISAYNIIKERWENLDLSTVDIAESQMPSD